MKRIIHYKRVSTTEQKTERQTVVMGAKVYEDKCSGSIPFIKRDYGRVLMDEIMLGHISEVHVHSIDRLGRNTLDIMQTIQTMTENGVNVISEKEGLRTLTNEGKENPIAKLMIGILGTLAEFELNRLKERQREGIAIAKERGTYVTHGKVKGQGILSNAQILAKHKKVVKQLKKGNSIRVTANNSGVAPATVQKVKAIMELED
jgi:DNA invertase Pin-like site-specific DNA recombinase